MFCGAQGLVRYWHIGNNRNANAIVARTMDKHKVNHSKLQSHSLFNLYMEAKEPTLSRAVVYEKIKSITRDIACYFTIPFKYCTFKFLNPLF